MSAGANETRGAASMLDMVEIVASIGNFTEVLIPKLHGLSNPLRYRFILTGYFPLFH